VASQGLSVFERYYAEDAVEMPSFQPFIEGKSAILDFYRPYGNNPSFKLTWKPSRAEVSGGWRPRLHLRALQRPPRTIRVS
jgi:hypothetical protein